MTVRTQMLTAWLEASPLVSEFSIEPASGDASFRRYFRIRSEAGTYIAMDAPPENEDCRPFIRVAAEFSRVGLHVPKVMARDLENGFLLLEDLGNQHYLDVLSPETAGRLYGDALGALVIIQTCGPTQGLAPYDSTLLMREMELFRHWLVEKQLALHLEKADHDSLDASFSYLVDNALEQPRVCVHRDYHSRNLLVSDPPSPGILDFQDAVVGPVTYDLVSLLRDCYIEWPAAQVDDWAMGYYELALQSGILQREQEQLFLRWFDLMGVQRHLKASGIFARLNQRDRKSGYLKDIPRTLRYVVTVASKYPRLHALGRLVADRVLPAFQAVAAHE